MKHFAKSYLISLAIVLAILLAAFLFFLLLSSNDELCLAFYRMYGKNGEVHGAAFVRERLPYFGYMALCSPLTALCAYPFVSASVGVGENGERK